MVFYLFVRVLALMPRSFYMISSAFFIQYVMLDLPMQDLFQDLIALLAQCVDVFFGGCIAFTC